MKKVYLYHKENKTFELVRKYDDGRWNYLKYRKSTPTPFIDKNGVVNNRYLANIYRAVLLENDSILQVKLCSGEKHKLKDNNKDIVLQYLNNNKFDYE